MKKKLRKQHLDKRSKHSKESVLKKSLAIEKRLFSSSHYKKAKTVMFYASFRDEVPTTRLILDALNDKVVVLPKIDLDTKTIIPIKIDSLGRLEENSFGISEPTGEEFKENSDIVIVPAVTYDKKGHRIGYGQGYYDQFLKDYKGIKIGLVFENHLEDVLPVDAHDVSVDIIITEKRTINIQK
ncbi:5-formyltetrahydrofolate cyclo-ligase [Candidatus Woesearchaeota archaeon]|nr:5-formyltetrahydrofolate cyclo-ligase [Candidatus Woesearchaeota archaeon]